MMSDFNEKEFRKNVEKNKEILKSHVKEMNEGKKTKEITETITSLNGITNAVMIVVGILAFTVWYFWIK